MEQTNQPPDKREKTTEGESSGGNDPFAEIGQGQEVEASTPAVSGTTIPVDFGTPSIHMEDTAGDLFAKLGSGTSGSHEELAGNGERLEGESSASIQLVEDAANDLFDTLGVEHYSPEAEHREEVTGTQNKQEMEATAPAALTDSDISEVSNGNTSTVLEDQTEVAEEVHKTSGTTPNLETTSATGMPASHESTTEASDVLDTLDTSDPLDPPAEATATLDADPTGQMEAEPITEPATGSSDIFDTIDTSDPMDLPSEVPTNSRSPPAPTADESGIILDDGGDGDDVFATLGANEAETVETIDQPKGTASPAQPAARAIELVETANDALFDNIGVADEAPEPGNSTIELVETEHDSIFDNLGTVEQRPPAEGGDPLEEQERKYQLLLEEFGGEEQEFLPEKNTAYQAASLFGEEESTPFDELEPEYLQTASSSTTPPPNLSIENSLQDIEPYEGDTSMVTDTSDWLKDPSTDDQSFQVQDSAAPGGHSSPVDFEVPYGWYEGDTFHYYTNEQREQVRLAMLESQPQSTQSASNNEDSSVAPLQAPSSGFSENAARRTPNPEQFSDPYGPSSSRFPATSSTGSYFGDSQYTGSTATTDPYAPVSSQPSSARPYDPYAPTTPAAAPYDPYAEVVPAKQPIYYGRQKKPAAFAKSAPAARPAPPTRVASTAYDPPFLRPQKSFVRPASAASLASTSYGVPPLPVAQVSPTPPPPAAPPSGPPRRSTTPYAPPPPIVEQARQPTPVQTSAYAPVQNSAYAPVQTSEYAPEESDSVPPIAPPAAPPKGPPSRASSSMAAPRQAQRAPSYNAFDPPLRTQTLSRASMKAAQPVLPPPQKSPAPSFALSPPSENVAHFDGSRPSSRAATFEAPSRPSSRTAPGFEAPPLAGPPRPSSRAASAVEAAQPGPPRPSSRTASTNFEAGPTGPPRPPSRATPAFEAPPPGPPRRSASSFQPPPRPPSTTYQAPPRQPSPLSHAPEQESENRYEQQEEHLTPPVSSFAIPQLHSGTEPDEEGGAWNNDEEDDFERRDSTYESRQPYEHEREVTDEPEDVYGRPSARQEHDSYSSEATYAPAPARSTHSPVQAQSTSYDPYGSGHTEAPTQETESDDRYESSYAPAPAGSGYFPIQSGYSPQSRQASYDPYGSGQRDAPVKETGSTYAPPPARSGYSPGQQPTASYDPYGPGQHDAPSKGTDASYAPPPARSGYSPVKQHTASYDPYGPGQQDAATTRNAPPASAPYNPYAPITLSPRAPLAEPSSLGLSSLGSSAPGQNTYDSPYAPARPAVDQYTPGADSYLRVASPGTEYGTSPPANNYFSALAAGPADQTYTPQQVLDQRPVSEDPLGRSTLAARNAPIAIFGFGGVLITAFPGIANVQNEAAGGHARTASYGYASGRGQLWIRNVSDLVSESALKSNETVFPGPLVLDPSSAKGAAGDKKKKEAVLAYLKARVEETEMGLPYLKTSANATRREQEGKLVLLRLLLAMIVGEGKLTGSTQVEDAIREALQNPSSPSTSSTTFSPTSTTGPASNGFSTSLYQGTNQNAPSTAATPAQLAQLSTMLSNGDKRDAALYAASNGLWSHALLISSSVDQEFWREIVSRFSGAELHAGVTGSAGLKASYTLFAGANAATIDDLLTAAHISDDPSADQWREVVGAVLFNGKATDLAHLDELGARLTAAGLINAGHVCSLLSPTSAFADLTPGALERPITLVQSTRDEDAVIFAEIAEYARSLIPVPKGQELPFPGLPQLLPYKLHRAWWAAELGDHDLAKRYCTAVESASKVNKTGTSLLSRPFLNSLEDLQERLTGEPSTKPANLIGGRKAGKPGVNKLGSWIEGRLTKFIAGEEDTQGPIKATPPVKGKETGAPVGPFSHFSTISPGPSNPVTRATSTADIANGQYGGRLSPAPQGGHQPTSSSSSSIYGEQYNAGGSYGGYNPYSGDNDNDDGNQEDTPHALEPAGDSGEVELLNPMAALSLGPTRQPQNDYGPAPTRHVEEEEDDDLGFGNTSLSRARTPKPAEVDDKSAAKKKEPAAKATPEPAAGKNEPKSGWLRGWFGKKEGEGSGPIVAKLGEESSMVFDPELKRWIVKGAKPEPAAAAPPPPPPSRPSSAAPASRASSATPPPSMLSRSTGSAGSSNGMPPKSGMGFTEMPDGGIRRQKSSLAESVTPGMTPPPPGPPGAGGPPRPPSGPPKPPGSSIDDLLSRPPTKRPASAARKGVKNRYVDVFQGQGT